MGRRDRVPAQRPRSGLGSGCWGLALSGFSGYRQQSAQLTPDGAVTPGVGKTNPGQQLSGGPATLPASRLGSPAAALALGRSSGQGPRLPLQAPLPHGPAWPVWSGVQLLLRCPNPLTAVGQHPDGSHSQYSGQPGPAVVFLRARGRPRLDTTWGLEQLGSSCSRGLRTAEARVPGGGAGMGRGQGWSA